MSADTIPDKYQAIGTPAGDTSDTLSAQPIGNPTVPAPADRLVHTPINAGTPAPAP